MAHSTVVPPVDLAPTGHLPHVVQAADAEAQRVAQLAAGPCPTYRDCTVTEPGHYDHFSATKVLDDADGSTVIDAGLTAISGDDQHAIVYLRNAEFTDAASVRAKTAEIRRFLDEVDELADRVFVDHGKRG